MRQIVMSRATLALALVLGGCSIISTKSVADVGAEKCSVSPGPAAIDTLMVAALAAFAVYASYEMEDTDHIAVPAAIGTGIVYTISAGVGYSRASRCKRAKIKAGLPY